MSGEKLRVTYKDGAETYTVTIHPYQAYARQSGVQVIAFCEQSGEVEYYRLERLSRIERTGDAYRREAP
jgi:predicted DNA-binding transcriptional regulator YafY